MCLEAGQRAFIRENTCTLDNNEIKKIESAFESWPNVASDDILSHQLEP
jgi:hypothetical protein